MATHFILSLQESRLFDILDSRVVKEGGKEEIMVVAYLAYRCLNLNEIKRPTMKEVATELEHIRASLPYLKVECDAPFPGCPLTTRQPAEFYVSHVMKHT